MPEEELDARTWSGLEYLEAVSGPGAIAEMVNGYVKDAPGRLARMKAAMEVGETQVLSRLAHDLKSNSATIGALRLSSVAARIERQAGDGSKEDLDAMIAEAESLLPSVLVALEDKARSYPG